jgi:hypothetical protein
MVFYTLSLDMLPKQQKETLALALAKGTIFKCLHKHSNISSKEAVVTVDQFPLWASHDQGIIKMLI